MPRLPTRRLMAALALSSLVPAFAAPGPGECPQPRFTGKAPDEFLAMKNPLDAAALDVARAQRLYLGETPAANCEICHGRTGNGRGALASQYDPPPRNFACAKTVNEVPDGQLFWIIRNGSPGTAMPGHPRLSEAEVWQLVGYLRRLAK